MAQIMGTVVADSVNAFKEREGTLVFAQLLQSLDEETRAVFATPFIKPTDWYDLDRFCAYLRADIDLTANGDARVLVDRSAQIVDRQLNGVFRFVVKLLSPESLLNRLSLTHRSYFNDVEGRVITQSPGHAIIRYTGLEPQHELIGYSIIGFFTQALKMAGAKNVHAEFVRSIGSTEPPYDLALTWTK